MKMPLTILGCTACIVLVLIGIKYRYEGWILEGYTFLGVGVWSSLLFLQEIPKIQEKQLGQ